MVATQLDLAYVVGVTTCYMSNPGTKHWETVKHILRQLRGIMNMNPTYGIDYIDIPEGYTISDDARNQKATFSYCMDYTNIPNGYTRSNDARNLDNRKST